jgi:hypothetical protein
MGQCVLTVRRINVIGCPCSWLISSCGNNTGQLLFAPTTCDAAPKVRCAQKPPSSWNHLQLGFVTQVKQSSTWLHSAQVRASWPHGVWPEEQVPLHQPQLLEARHSAAVSARAGCEAQGRAWRRHGALNSPHEVAAVHGSELHDCTQTMKRDGTGTGSLCEVGVRSGRRSQLRTHSQRTPPPAKKKNSSMALKSNCTPACGREREHAQEEKSLRRSAAATHSTARRRASAASRRARRSDRQWCLRRGA